MAGARAIWPSAVPEFDRPAESQKSQLACEKFDRTPACDSHYKFGVIRGSASDGAANA